MVQDMKENYRSVPRIVLLGKVSLPLLCVWCGGELLDFQNGVFTWRSLLAVPFFIVAFFGASLAILEVRDDVVRYRRLIKWTTLPTEEIVSARVEAAPLAGSVRLNRFLFPWGRLYFVLDAKSTLNPFRTEEYPMLRYLCKRAVAENHDSTGEITQNSHVLGLKLLGGAVLGALFTGILRLVAGSSRSSQLPELVYAKRHPIFEVQWQVIHLLGNDAVVLVISTAFAFLALYRSRRLDSWILAFLAGAGLFHLVLRIV
jgi:hypothetical protein